ncbi:amidohydrolase [Longibacter salinarum]|uniref:Amidohydrolase n=1 Tax=Longibacter salinarum TaxID=1850348 RepID=A0A2A8D1S0_9BACT|nr:amidohydrolase family protein [Longibacter salinarum]PEN14912.1 amidohydrolase [Longibacter salinarum]
MTPSPLLPSPARADRGLLSVILSLLLFAIVLAWPPGQALAQEDVPSVTQTVAITNARVVQAPGDVIDRATVIIRDGLIEAVGDVDPPFDARIIEGDSLTVYAGFIDGLSHAGVDTPDDREDVEEGSYAESGIQPQRDIRPMLDPDKVDDLREAGFGLAHVAPEGYMLPGHGGLIFLAGDNPDEMILADRASLFAQMKGAPGGWPNVVAPSTPMAVIAQMRDLVRETRRRQMLAEAYEDDPRGRNRPPSDAVHSAFVPVLNGQFPVAFYAENALDTHRILAMADELDLPIMMAGLGDAFETVDALEEANVPLFLTLKLPEPADGVEPDTSDADTTRADAPGHAVTPDDPSSFFKTDLRITSEDDLESEEQVLKARQQSILKQYRSNAATLHDAGLQFGFTTIDAKPGDIRDNLRVMIEHGLPEDVALAALTTNAASLLGLSDQLGTVESGKIANLVVTDGDFFSEDTSIQYVFVDGKRFPYTSDESEAEVTGSVEALVGTWKYELETPQGTTTGEIVLEGDEDNLSGTISGAEGDETTDLENISFDGTTLSFDLNAENAGQLSVTVDVEGDQFEGSVSGAFGSFPITGSRTSPDGR